MPFIKLDTNVKVEENTKKEISKAFGELISIIPGKSENFLMTKVEDENFMTFGGSDAPCAMVDIAQFGSENKDAYGKLTAAICDKVGPMIGVEPSRIFVKYAECLNWGMNGHNF